MIIKMTDILSNIKRTEKRLRRQKAKSDKILPKSRNRKLRLITCSNSTLAPMPETEDFCSTLMI